MVSFIHFLLENPKFATESTQTSLRKLTIKKNFKFSTSEFTKIRHFEITKQNICPLPDSFPGEGVPGAEGNIPSPHPTHFGASSPQLLTRVDATDQILAEVNMASKDTRGELLKMPREATWIGLFLSY